MSALPEPVHPRPPTPVEPAPAKRGGELTARLLTASILVPTVLYMTYLGGLWYVGTVIAIVLLAQREFYGLIEEKGAHPLVGFGLASGAALPVVAYLGSEYHVTLLMTATLLAVLFLQLGKAQITEALASTSGTFFGIFYVGWLLSHAVPLRNFHHSVVTRYGPGVAESYGITPESGIFYMVFALTAVVLCDAGAYFGGKAYGKRKLAPQISPGKSVEGAICGVLAAMLGCIAMKAVFDFRWPELSRSISWEVAAAFAVALAMIAILGDLVESLLKRDAAAKDAGSLLPGMGGVLDRIDSAVFGIPLMYYMLLFYVFLERADVLDRYSRPEMREIWSEEGRYRRWLEVELAATAVLAERGVVPADAADEIRRRADFDASRIAEIEREVRHDVIAFLTNVAEHVGEPARWVHFGMTSSDVLDTALALQLRDAGGLLRAGIERLASALARRAREFRDTPCVGRTHGVHAEPTTFGLKLLVFLAEVRRQGERFERALDEVVVGKISGAVGTFAHLPPDVEEAVCRRLEIGFEPAATQVVQRDRHAAFASVLALLASTLEKLAVELRHLARTEVREVEEEFGTGQKGSSAMPHKKNPWRLENVSGLARVMRGYAAAALENQALWHERDISNSSVERVVFPDATATLDFMLQRTAGLVETLVVHPERMRENLELTRGLVFSGSLLLELARKGLSREEAYALVQRHALATFDEGGDFRERVTADPELGEVLSKEELDRAFSLDESLRHVGAIFERVLGET